MSDMLNNYSGDSSSASYNTNYNVQSTNVKKTEQTQNYSNNWKRMPRPFGLNVRVPETPVIGVKTQKLIVDTIKDMAMAPIQPVIDYFKDNENIFNGNVSREIESLNKQQKLTVELLQNSDEIVMESSLPSFMMDM